MLIYNSYIAIEKEAIKIVKLITKKLAYFSLKMFIKFNNI